MNNNILIRGAYGESNFGDDLLMVVFEDYFNSQFKANLIFEGKEASYTKKLLKVSKYNIKVPYQLIVYGGGTQFFAFSNKNGLSMLEIIYLLFKSPSLFFKKFYYNIFKNPTKHRENYLVKTAFLGIGLGPFSNNQLIIDQTKYKLDQSFYVGVRDHIAKMYCDKWNIKSTFGADVVFSNYFIPYINSNSKNEQTNKIGIIVRDWQWDESGREFYQPLLDMTSNIEDYEFEFIIFAPFKDKEWVSKLDGKKTVVWDPDNMTIKEYINKLNEYSAFISARYHGAIIACLLNKPVICIEVEDKLRILSEQIKEIQLWEKPFNENELLQLILNLNFNVNYDNSIINLRDKANLMLDEFKRKYENEL